VGQSAAISGRITAMEKQYAAVLELWKHRQQTRGEAVAHAYVLSR
jgi:hypothetical protein